MYRMPKVSIGDPILFYLDGDATRDPQFGHVIEVGGMSVGVKISLRSSGPDRLVPSVIHVSDPRMQNPEIRRDGAWDFHPRFKKIEERLVAIEKHLGIKKAE